MTAAPTETPGRAPPGAAERGGRHGRGEALALTGAATVVALAAMPFIYGLVAFHGAWANMLKPQILQHTALNTLANVLVMLSAVRLTGRVDQRLTGVFARTVVAHGGLAFFILATRSYYSIPMLMTGAAASAILGALVVLIGQRSARLKIGVLGPWLPILDSPGLDAEQVDSPDASIRHYDLLLVTSSGEPSPAIAADLSRALAAGKRVRHVAEFAEEIHGVVAIDHFELDHLPEGGLTSYRTGKRLFDLLASVILLPFAAPIIVIASAAIVVTMGSPVFFTQPRVGQGGRVFRIVKLRTMRPDPAEGGGVATAIGDDRITALGRWLRRFHVDELPQLWNVLAGDMSMVGPRPEQPQLAQAYSRQVPAFAYRQLVRPGITGWAQVRAGYAADLAETRVKLRYDLFYLKNFSFGLDVQILARTVWTLVSGGGVR
jgi:lipopolysaccharide/colanic/teichoic acid biosynthesis glycosyltransferase